MAMKKVDLSGVKSFLIAKGEKVVLGVIFAIGTLLVLNGMMAARNSNRTAQGKTLQQALTDSARRLESAIASAKLDPEMLKPYSVGAVTDGWREVPSTFPYYPFIQMSEGGDYKRRNPYTVPVPSNQGNRVNIQVDYIPAGFLVYEIDRERKRVSVLGNRGNEKGGFPGGGVGPGPGGGIDPFRKPGGVGGAGGGPKFGGALPLPGEGGAGGAVSGAMVKSLRPQRMVLVRAAFPMAEQIEVFKKHLRLATIEELRAAGELPPRFLGVNVKRLEMDDQGQIAKETDVFWFDVRDEGKIGAKVKVSPAMDTFLREMILDTEQNSSNYHLSGLVMPLPVCANGAYPPLRLTTVKDELLAANENRPGFPGGQGDPAIMKKPAFSIIEPKKQPVGPGGVANPNEPAAMALPQGNIMSVDWRKLPPNELVPRFEGDYFAFDPTADKRAEGFQRQLVEDENGVIYDSLIRFFDVDVVPGKTYRYKFQVRMLNPNYEKPKEVAFRDLAKIKEIVSPWTYTPAITVPQEYFLYAADQVEPDEKNKKKLVARGPDSGKLDAEHAPVQIHRWLGRVTDADGDEHAIGDWAIAERVLVRRGEYIGRRNTIVQVPTWNKTISDFILDVTARKKAQRGSTPLQGIPLDFTATNPPPLLVDFDGGRKGRFYIEESAVDLLILTPDGRLIVRNTRHDSDNETAEGFERLKRYEAFRERLQRYSANAVVTDPALGNPMVPMPKGGKGP